MSYFIAAQLVGVLTAVVSIIIVQFKKIRWILVGEVLSNLLISVSYALVGEWLEWAIPYFCVNLKSNSKMMI